MVPRMANIEEDPGASTQQFRAYKEGNGRGSEDTAKASAARRNLIIGAILVVVAIVAVIGFALQ